MRPRGLIASQAGPGIEEPGSLQVAGVLAVAVAQPAPAGVAQQYLAGPFGEGDLTGQPRLHPLFQPVAWNGQPPCGSIYSARPTDALICRIVLMSAAPAPYRRAFDRNLVGRPHLGQPGTVPR